MATGDIKGVLAKLNSSKVKDRAEGLNALRGVLGRDSSVNHIDESGNKTWLIVFQHVFNVVVLEKGNCVKKTTRNLSSGNAAEGRLRNAAETVRWLVERCLHKLNRKAVQTILVHLLQTIGHDGKLFELVALHYIKSIRCVLSYSPHLESLDSDLWIRIVEMAWNIILGDPLRRHLNAVTGAEDSIEDVSTLSAGDEGEDEDEEDEDINVRSPKKRRRRVDEDEEESKSSRKQRKRSASATPGPSSRRATPFSSVHIQSISHEQIECTALLAILLRDPSAPLLSGDPEGHDVLASQLLERHRRFIDTFRADTSLHQDFLAGLSATLSHLALNKRDDVTNFARQAWDGLLGMWGLKNKNLKEHLVVILRTLFPFYTSRTLANSIETPFDYTQGLAALWAILDSEVDNRRGFEGLSLGCLRFQVHNSLNARSSEPTGAFVARTFQYDLNFDAAQAFTWSILELQADCVAKLVAASERTHSSGKPGKREDRRAKLENPIAALVDSIQASNNPTSRTFHLQTVLFFIDRHWPTIHIDLRRKIMQPLIHFISFDDATIQSWTFLCLAAVAQHQGDTVMDEPVNWDNVWAHAMRRAIAPAVSRTACHLAHILLRSSNFLLSTPQILLEIETFAKDLDIQGPPYPYDSVCMLMVSCLQIANQDVRLYRMHIEDKVLSWLSDAWTHGEALAIKAAGKKRIARPFVSDILAVLETICALPVQSSLICRAFLPESPVVEQAIDDQRTFVIKMFLLESRLPSFRHSLQNTARPTPKNVASTDRLEDLSQPGLRERKVSANVLRFIEAQQAAIEIATDVIGALSEGRCHQLIDAAILAISFESSLVLNGMRPSARVLQAASKLIVAVLPALSSRKWSREEQAAVLLAFEPLVSDGEPEDEDEWGGLVAPTKGIGIRREALKGLVRSASKTDTQTKRIRRDLQRIIWQSAEMQDVLADIMKAMKSILRSLVTKLAGDPRSMAVMDDDDNDGFAPTRSTSLVTQAPGAREVGVDSSVYNILSVCISFLSIGPGLQSATDEPTRDRDLSDFLFDADGDEFLLAAPPYLSNIRRGNLYITITVLDNLLLKVESLLKQPIYAHNETLQCIVISLLDSTTGLWLQQASEVETRSKVQDIFRWLGESLEAHTMRSWRVRDKFAAFLARYITLDPQEVFWFEKHTQGGFSGDSQDNDQDEGAGSPFSLLPTLSSDVDIRVRFRAARSISALFLAINRASEPLLDVYNFTRDSLCRQLGNYEHMLTRFLALGNIMIASAAVARGPYWHLVETCIFCEWYNDHVTAVLEGVASRMNLPRRADLLLAYASQVAASACELPPEQDFLLRINPTVLGFGDRRSLGEVIFRTFAQRYAHCADLKEHAIEIRRGHLAAHCQVIGKQAHQGLQEAFPDILAFELVWCVKWAPQEVDEHLARCFADWEGDVLSAANLCQSLDTVFTAILRMLGDQDVTYDCGVVNSLQERYPERHYFRYFRELTGFRALSGVPQTFPPNSPAESSGVILDALDWVKNRVGGGLTAAVSYHIFHRLVADVHNMPLVNEQLRLMNSLCLWISLHRQHFGEPTLLHIIIRSSTILLAQYDIARAAQSILAWAFKQSKTGNEPKQSDGRLTDILIWIATLATRYADSEDHLGVKLGKDLLEFIEEQTVNLLDTPYLGDQCVRALQAWPCEPSLAKLNSLRHSSSVAMLTDMLEDPRIVANKFRLVRRLFESSHSGYSPARFSRIDFWRLKECIPLRQQLSIEDVDAFALLLSKFTGQVHGFGIDPLSSHVSRPVEGRTRRKTKSPADIHEIEEPERVLLEHLLCILDSDVPERVHAAYGVLRSIPLTKLPKLSDWTPEYALEMKYFLSCPRAPIQRPLFNLHDLPSLTELAEEFQPWVSAIATAICDVVGADRPFFAQLPSVLYSDPGFAELALPTLVHTLLRTSADSATTTGDSSTSAVLSRYFTDVLSSPKSDVLCHRAIVNIALHLREFYPAANDDDYLAYDKWLKIDYTLLSRSAIRCGAYTTALLFHELAFEYPSDHVSLDSMEEILFDIYSHIDEPDGFYGIQTHDFHRFLIKRFHHEQQWDKAFMFHGAALEAQSRDSSAAAAGVLHSLHSIGFNHLALGIQTNDLRDITDASAMSYDLGWRTQSWDLPEPSSASSESGDALYRALRAIHRGRDPGKVDVIINHALADVMERLRVLGDEDLVGIRGATQELLCLYQVRQWQSASTQSDLIQRRLGAPAWQAFTQIESDFEFKTLENIMATRMSLLLSVRQKEQRQQIGDMVSTFTSNLKDIEKQCLLRVSQAARASNHLQVALNSVVRARALESQPTSLFSQEFASVLWDQKEHNVAIQTLKDIANRYYVTGDQEVHASTEKALLLSRLGTWSSEACMQKPMSIWEEYFDPAAKMIGAPGYQADTSTTKIFYECAIFADRQYHALSRSPDIIRRKVYVDRTTKEVDELQSQHDRGRVDIKPILDKAARQLKADQQSYELHIGALRTFLQQAVSMYARCLESSSLYDDDAHVRLVSLWYANFDDRQLASVLGPAIERVPSSKFIFLSHQLAARLAKQDLAPPETKPHKSKSMSPEIRTNSQEILQKLVHRMCIEHPFHAVYQLFPLRPADGGAGVRRRQSQRFEPSQPQSQRDRAAAAGDIFAKLKNGPSAQRVRDVEIFCQACLDWAKHSIGTMVKNNPQKEYPVAKRTRLVEETFFATLRVPVPTAYTPVDPTMNYENCIWVKRYGSAFKTAGGINVPKIHDCFGSDGKKYTQLFKGEGNDDMRQDAVMEQVFELVDIALRRDRDTSKRNLSIRRYCVIPLAEQAGILEFVSNTMPLGDWLFAAHHKYRPKDMPPHHFTSSMTELRKRHRDTPALGPKLLEHWLKATPKLQPVMRHWFTEAHKVPMSWFAMRLNYTRSVATTSVIGHVLGLGDRHVRNILLDVASGEVVHIDLGIAFEQGKMLPVPELVPFRMTRDMVDGMGTSGVRGVFQRCAEETLRVLREDSEVILTVLEVFKYDPLHSWTASDYKINRAQDQQPQQQQQQQQPAQMLAPPTTVTGIGIDMNSGTAEEAADRALSAVARKLDRALSVEYTINELIAEATDPAILSRMYPLWSPHL